MLRPANQIFWALLCLYVYYVGCWYEPMWSGISGCMTLLGVGAFALLGFQCEAMPKHVGTYWCVRCLLMFNLGMLLVVTLTLSVLLPFQSVLDADAVRVLTMFCLGLFALLYYTVCFFLYRHQSCQGFSIPVPPYGLVALRYSSVVAAIILVAVCIALSQFIFHCADLPHLADLPPVEKPVTQPTFWDDLPPHWAGMEFLFRDLGDPPENSIPKPETIESLLIFLWMGCFSFVGYALMGAFTFPLRAFVTQQTPVENGDT